MICNYCKGEIDPSAKHTTDTDGSPLHRTSFECSESLKGRLTVADQPKSHSDLTWECTQEPLRRAVRDAWQAEMLKEPIAPDREATRDEMLRWTSAARKRLTSSIDGFLEDAINEYGKGGKE